MVADARWSPVPIAALSLTLLAALFVCLLSPGIGWAAPPSAVDPPDAAPAPTESSDRAPPSDDPCGPTLGQKEYQFQGTLTVQYDQDGDGTAEKLPLDNVQLRIVRADRSITAPGPHTTTDAQGRYSVTCTFAAGKGLFNGQKIPFLVEVRFRNTEFKVRKGGWLKNNWFTVGRIAGCNTNKCQRADLDDLTVDRTFPTGSLAGKHAYLWWFYDTLQDRFQQENVGLTDSGKLTVTYPDKRMVRGKSYSLSNVHIAHGNWNRPNVLIDAFMHRWDVEKFDNAKRSTCVFDAHDAPPDQWNSSRCSGFMEGFAQATASAVNAEVFGGPSVSPHSHTDLRNGRGVPYSIANRREAERSAVGWANLLELMFVSNEASYAGGSCDATDIGVFEMLRALQNKSNWNTLLPQPDFREFIEILQTYVSSLPGYDAAVYEKLADPSLSADAVCGARGEVFGLADLHLHQMAALGFAGLWFWPQHDGSLTANPTKQVGGQAESQRRRTKHAVPSIPEAAGDHGKILHGLPDPTDPDRWPSFNDIGHQQVHQTWLKDAHEEGLNLVVVSAVNYEPFCEILRDIHPVRYSGWSCRDMPSVRRQIQAAQKMDETHSWYRIALDPWHARQIIRDGDLAVVLSMEVSHPFPKDRSVSALPQLDALYDAGLRSLQLAHQTNSRFAGAAPHRDVFEFAEYLKHPKPPGQIGFKYDEDGKNKKGLTNRGERLLMEMMDRRMLVDIAHLSENAVDDVYQVMRRRSYYPMYDSHTRLKGPSSNYLLPPPLRKKQREFLTTAKQVTYLEKTGGMVGLRTAMDSLNDGPGAVPNTCHGSSQTYAQLVNYTASNSCLSMAFGSDLNGLATQLGPRHGSHACPKGGTSQQGSPPEFAQPGVEASFDTVGLSHVGYLPELLHDLDHLGARTTRLERSAEAFLQMWERSHEDRQGPATDVPVCPLFTYDVVIDGRGMPGQTAYTVTGSEPIQIDPSTGSLRGRSVTHNPKDQVDGSSATGRVSTGADGYRVTGSPPLITLTTPSAARVTVNGLEYHTVLIEAKDASSATRYTLEVPGRIAKTGGTLYGLTATKEDNDVVGGGTAKGTVDGDVDGFIVRGGAPTVNLDDPSAATVYIDGTGRDGELATNFGPRIPEERLKQDAPADVSPPYAEGYLKPTSYSEMTRPGDSLQAEPRPTASSTQDEDPESTDDSDAEDTASGDETDPTGASVPEGVTLTLMPRAGRYLSGVSTLADVSGGALATLGAKQSVFTWGASLALGSRDGPVNARLTGLRTTGSLTSTSEDAAAGVEEFPDRILLVTGDLVVRPVPRFIVQPYAIGGLGARRLSVSQAGEHGGGGRWASTAQIGAGVDVRIGDVTVGLEVADYLTGITESGGIQHNTFGFVTLGIPIY